MSENNHSVDINDVFDDILFTEERIIAESYEKGLKEGAQQDSPEGYHLGYHRGAELGAELGYYLGVLDSLPVQGQSDKVCKLLQSLKQELEEFPRENLEVDILVKADAIRSNYRRLCSLLKIDSTYPESDKLNF